MKGIFAAILAVVSLSFALPAGAITYGVRDDGEHPYVGLLVFFDPVEEDWFSCTGTLLSPTVMLTAGHCTFDIGTGGAATEGGSGGDDVWVTFEEDPDFSTFPPSADYPDDVAGLYAARSGWFQSNASFTRARSHPHPSFDDFEEFPNDHDVGVVVLDEPSAVGTFGVVAGLGTLEAIASKGRGHNKVLIETAGYGIQEVHPKDVQLAERWKSTSRIVNLKSHVTGEFNLQTSNNPSEAGGRGGACFGDSGGGLFLNDTNVVVAVVSFGNDSCKGTDYSARADVADVQDFLAEFVELAPPVVPASKPGAAGKAARR